MNRKTTLAIAGGLMLSALFTLPVKAFEGFGNTLGYGLGMGLVRSSFEGDFLKHESIYGLQLGLDYETNSLFAIVDVIGSMGSGSRMDDITMAIGGGFRWAKLGIGAITRKCRGPSIDSPRFPSVTALGLTNYDTSSFPLYLRIHPLDTRYVLGTIDAYYGLDTQGKASINLIDNSGNNYSNETEIKSTGGNYGYRGALIFRLGVESNQVIMVDYRIDKGRTDPSKPVSSGLAGMAIGFTNRILNVSYSALF